MALYTVTIANELDDTTRIELILSHEPLTKNSSSLLNGLIKLDKENYFEFIYKVEIKKVLLNSWDVNEHNEFSDLSKKLLN